MTDPVPDLRRDLGRRLSRAAELTPESPGQALWVCCPRVELDLGVAVGLADRRSGTPLTEEHTVRVASIGKSFTALAAIRLVEDGRLELDRPLRPELTTGACWRVVRDHGYDAGAITLRQLLGHTSGLPDYAEQPDGAYAAAVLAEPARAWTPEEQVAFALGHYPSAGAPGRQHAYSDTGYVLVGEVIERATGAPLAAAVRRLADYARAGLDDTYLELLEPAASSAPRATQYAGDVDLTHEVSPTVDLFGGGGQVSSLRDVAHFYRFLGRGEAFATAAGRAAMAAPVSPQQPRFGLGVFGFDLADRPFVGHSGSWGLVAGYCAELDLAVAHSWNQMAVEDHGPLLEAREWLVRRLVAHPGVRR